MTSELTLKDKEELSGLTGRGRSTALPVGTVSEGHRIRKDKSTEENER